MVLNMPIILISKWEGPREQYSHLAVLTLFLTAATIKEILVTVCDKSLILSLLPTIYIISLLHLIFRSDHLLASLFPMPVD